MREKVHKSFSTALSNFPEDATYMCLGFQRPHRNIMGLTFRTIGQQHARCVHRCRCCNLSSVRPNAYVFKQALHNQLLSVTKLATSWPQKHSCHQPVWHVSSLSLLHLSVKSSCTRNSAVKVLTSSIVMDWTQIYASAVGL